MYSNLDKYQLIEKIESLEKEIEVLKKEKNTYELIHLPWSGNLGQWYWFIKDNKVICNEKKVTTLGYQLSDVDEKKGYEFFTDKLHPDDYEMVMDNMRCHMMGETEAYEVEYRILHKDGYYCWFYDRGRVVETDNMGNPMVVSGIVFDISKNKELESKLRDMAEKDFLTNCYNRRFFVDNLKLYMKNCEKLTIVMCDIDDFKKVNDTYGHDIGDKVLVEFSNIIRNNIRKNDILSRWGGEEFIILFEDTDLIEAYNLTNRILEIIRKTNICNIKNLTASFGICQYNGSDTFDNFLSKVDLIMYNAKKNGKNRIEVEKNTSKVGAIYYSKKSVINKL